MKIYHITEAPRVEPTVGKVTPSTDNGPKLSSTKTASTTGTKSLTGITGTKAAFANKNGGVSKGTIVGPAKNGNPNQVSFKDSKGKTFNVSVKKLLDPKKLTPLNIGASTSTTKPAPKADAPKADLKADPKPKVDDKKPKPKANKAKISFLSKTFKALTRGGLTQLIFSTQFLTLQSDKYIKHIEAQVNNGTPIDVANDPVLKRIRYDVAEHGVTTLMAFSLTVTAGGAAASRIIRTIGLASATFPGAGWVAAAIAGATWLGVGYVTQLVAGWLSSRAFAEGIVDMMIKGPFSPQHVHDYIKAYATLMDKPVPESIESLEESNEGTVDFASIGKELMDPKLKAALVKAKQKGATGKTAIKVLDKRLDSAI